MSLRPIDAQLDAERQAEVAIQRLNAAFVRDLEKISPRVAAWGRERLAEGFYLSEVQRVLRGTMKQAEALR